MIALGKLLFLAFHFPPERNVACVRTFHIAKHLSRIGWDVTVVTPDPELWCLPKAELLRAAEALDQYGIKRLYTGQRYRTLYSGYSQRSYSDAPRRVLRGVASRIARVIELGTVIDWCREVERTCATLRPDDVDILLVTGSPFGAFTVAQRISRRLNCPYMLDYRDLWSGNPHMSDPCKSTQSATESLLLKDSAAVSVVSVSMAKYLRETFGLGSKVHVITNGYDPDAFRDIKATVFGHFALVYTGRFYPPKRTVTPLMRVLRRLLELHVSLDWRFHYYGPESEYVREVASQYGVEARVVIHGVVKQEEALSAIRGAGVAMVVVFDAETGSLSDKGIITGKIFEPIGLGTPLLVVAPPGFDVNAIVQEAGNGSVFSGADTEAMARYVMRLMGELPVASKSPDHYCWSHLIKNMNSVLSVALSGRVTGRRLIAGGAPIAQLRASDV